MKPLSPAEYALLHSMATLGETCDGACLDGGFDLDENDPVLQSLEERGLAEEYTCCAGEPHETVTPLGLLALRVSRLTHDGG